MLLPRRRPALPGQQLRRLSVQVFDRALKGRQRDAAAAAADFDRYAYLRDEVANRLVERLDDIHDSYSFPEVVDLGSGSGHVRRALGAVGNDRHIRRLREFDMSPSMLERSRAEAASSPPTHGPEARALTVEHVLADEEVLSLERESADLIVSCMGLHWVNDLPSTLRNIRRALKPNGLFLGAFLGGETLAEMRSSFVLADLERRGGVSQHMSPLVSVADAGALLQASGLALPTVDTEIISIGYPDAWTLWHHLRCMGESNANLRRSASSLDNMLAAAATYKEVYGDADGNVPGTFQVIYLIGWAPHESQQRPLARGSGQISLKDLGLPDARFQLDEPMPPKLDAMMGRTPKGDGSGRKGEGA